MTTKSTCKSLNLGCGLNKFDHAINVDVDPDIEPDVVWDITKYPYPWKSESFEVVYLLHTIEHLIGKEQIEVLNEIRRILVSDGILVIAYPEFIKIALNYINNKDGERDFWRATIYGRQLTKSDYHVSLMDTRYFKQVLYALRFEIISTRPEKNQDHNTLVIAQKSSKTLTREQVLKEEIFGE